MQLEDYPKEDGMRVWLNADEISQVLDFYADDIFRWIGLALAARCGLRRGEVVGVRARNVTRVGNGDHALFLEDETKGDKKRETPIPPGLASSLTTFIQAREMDPDDIVIHRDDRQVYRWTKAVADHLRSETEDDRWRYLTPHDLRRSWAMRLVEAEVYPYVIMRWGGWSDFEYFKEHYLTRVSENMEQRQRAKVDWL